MLARIALVALVLSFVPTHALAQLGEPDPAEQARVRLGPIAFTPTLSIKNLGWETNVFNSPDNPQEEFIFTPAGTINWWLRVGRARLVGVDEVSYSWFQKFPEQGGFNQSHSLTFEVPLARVKPYLTGAYLDTNDRVGYEIDARARHTETTARGGVVTRLTAKTGVDIYARYTRFRYTGDETFLDSTLAEQFNREAQGAGVTLRYALTPLTTLTLTGDWAEQRYEEQSTRDNSSLSIVPGVEFKPAALLKGTATVGYKRFDALNVDIPDFEGVVAKVDISYVLLGRTRFSVNVYRDIQFSFETLQPYYLQTGLGGSIRQGLGMGWDVEVRGAWYQLDYQTSTRADQILKGRVDEIVTYGGGVGYSLSSGSRVAFYIDYQERSSPTLNFRAYDGLRYGFTVTVGL